MMQSFLSNNWSGFGMPLGMGFLFGAGGIFMLAAIVWTIYWKGRALWLAAKRNERCWFIALLIINTLGILEILYIYIFSKKQKENKEEQATPTAV
jgi:hypothetical protein